MTDATDELLAARRQTHGDYGANAELIQGIMRLLEAAPRWPEVSDVHREGIHMIVHKVSRALNGDPMEPDHFDDVAGYAKLIANWIRTKKKSSARDGAATALTEDCPGCIGTGQIRGKPCDVCQGIGKVRGKFVAPAPSSGTAGTRDEHGAAAP